MSVIANHKRYASTIESRDKKDMLSLADYIVLKEQNVYLKDCLETMKKQKMYTKECALIEENLSLKIEISNLKNKLSEQEALLRKAKLMLSNMQEDTLLYSTIQFRKANENTQKLCLQRDVKYCIN
jgi:regulator of replication initiation timing